MNQLAMGGSITNPIHCKKTNDGAPPHSWSETLTGQKTLISQQEAFQAARKHDADSTAKSDKTNFKDNDERRTFTEQKLGACEDYAKSHARLPDDFQKILDPPPPPEPDRQRQRGRGGKPDRPKPISVPFAEKPKPAKEAQSRQSANEMGGKRPI